MPDVVRTEEPRPTVDDHAVIDVGIVWLPVVLRVGEANAVAGFVAGQRLKLVVAEIIGSGNVIPNVCMVAPPAPVQD